MDTFLNSNKSQNNQRKLIFYNSLNLTWFWCPGPDSNRHRSNLPRDFKSLASTYSATRADFQNKLGGWGRNRTGVHGFAGRCITTLPPSHSLCKKKNLGFPRFGLSTTTTSLNIDKLERETRLELATPTLARLCSTN